MRKLFKIMVRDIAISFVSKDGKDYVSLTDIARFKDQDRSDYVIQNWLRNRETVEYLGLWEKINNPHFNSIEFDGFKSQSGLNSFSLTPQRWIATTHATGIVSKPGRYGGGTYAHKDIAFEFASWISPEFKLYLIKEFQRLKEQENERLELGWDLKRALTKINYRIHTDAIQAHLIPNQLSKQKISIVYASEADVLNMALFGKTAKMWRDENPKENGNVRDYADVTQLVVLANLEGINAELIKRKISQPERLSQLNQIAIFQMQSLVGNPSIKKLKEKVNV